MEQSKIVDTLKTSLMVNLWAERYNIVVFLIAVIVAICAQFSLFMFFELLLIASLVTGIVAFGFVGIAAHIRYYSHFERNRKVELYTDRIVISKKDQIVKQIFKNDITKIMLHDRLRTGGSNFFMTLMDSFYYLVVIGKNQERVILTCLLDIRLKKKIAAWYGQELEHKYQFFPFPLTS